MQLDEVVEKKARQWRPGNLMVTPTIFKQTNYQTVDMLKNTALNIVEAFEIIMIKIWLAREKPSLILKNYYNCFSL